MESRPYTPGMGRPIAKPRPAQGARLAALRKAAGLSQAELAKALGVRVEDLLGSAPVAAPGRPGPVGKLQRALEQAAVLPRRQQELVVEFVNTLVQRQKRAS